MNWIPIIACFGTFACGIILGMIGRNQILQEQDKALIEADEAIYQLHGELDATNTKLAAEKAENAALCETCDLLRSQVNIRDIQIRGLEAKLAPFTAARNRRLPNGKFAPKLAKVA